MATLPVKDRLTMRIIVVGHYIYPMYAPAISYGMRKLGHEVFEIRTERYCHTIPLFSNILNRLMGRFHVGFPLRKYNKDIIDLAEKERPDCLFFYHCYNVWPSTYEKLRSLGHKIITYNNDDPFCQKPDRWYARYFISSIKYADINFVYRKKNVAEYNAFGSKCTRILLPYFLEKSNFRMKVMKDIPVAFMGHFENDGRDALILSLKDAGIPVTLFAGGAYWSKAPLWNKIKEIARPSYHGAAYNEVLNRMQIALVFLSKINHDTYTRRCFEIPAAGTLMLSEYTEDMNALFPENECAVYFRSQEELVQKCRFLLSHPEEVVRIAENGYNRLIELGGSEVDRCREIIDIFVNLKE